MCNPSTDVPTYYTPEPVLEPGHYVTSRVYHPGMQARSRDNITMVEVVHTADQARPSTVLDPMRMLCLLPRNHD